MNQFCLRKHAIACRISFKIGNFFLQSNDIDIFSVNTIFYINQSKKFKTLIFEMVVVVVVTIPQK